MSSEKTPSATNHDATLVFGLMVGSALLCLHGKDRGRIEHLEAELAAELDGFNRLVSQRAHAVNQPISSAGWVDTVTSAEKLTVIPSPGCSAAVGRLMAPQKDLGNNEGYIWIKVTSSTVNINGDSDQCAREWGEIKLVTKRLIDGKETVLSYGRDIFAEYYLACNVDGYDYRPPYSDDIVKLTPTADFYFEVPVDAGQLYYHAEYSCSPNSNATFMHDVPRAEFEAPRSLFVKLEF